jgi:hypothetical protein
MATSVTVGTVATFTADFTLDDVLSDPGTVTFRLRRDGYGETTYVFGTDVEVVKDATGQYHADVSLDRIGTWLWRWEGTDPVVAVMEGTLSATSEYL